MSKAPAKCISILDNRHLAIQTRLWKMGLFRYALALLFTCTRNDHFDVEDVHENGKARCLHVREHSLGIKNGVCTMRLD